MRPSFFYIFTAEAALVLGVLPFLIRCDRIGNLGFSNPLVLRGQGLRVAGQTASTASVKEADAYRPVNLKSRQALGERNEGMADENNKNEAATVPLTKASIGDLIDQAGIKRSEAIAYIAKLTGVEVESQTGAVRIAKVWRLNNRQLSQSPVSHRLPEGFYQLAKRKDDGKSDVGVILHINIDGKITPSNKADYISTVPKSEYKSWTANKEYLAATAVNRGIAGKAVSQAQQLDAAKMGAEGTPMKKPAKKEKALA